MSRPLALFGYPVDGGMYLALPADNPLRFGLVREGYTTSAQFAEIVSAIERGVPDYVLVNLALVAPDDPVVAALERRYRRIGASSFVHVLYVRVDG